MIVEFLSYVLVAVISFYLGMSYMKRFIHKQLEKLTLELSQRKN